VYRYKITNGKKISDFDEKSDPSDDALFTYVENGTSYVVRKDELVNALLN
jgi:hypothetical protein